MTCHHGPVLLTLTTTREPATDLGYLLVKHPDRRHEFEVATGTAYVFFPEATPQRCTAALILDTDPARLVAMGRGRHASAPDGFTLGRYVNDRPYAASSLLAAALNRVFRSAIRGESRDRPDLAGQALPLTVRIPVLRCRGGAEVAQRLFAPLGWTVTTRPIPLDQTQPQWGESRYVDLTLAGEVRVSDALRHLYVLLPVLDDAKHYWVAPDEVDKLVRAGGDWLAGHPERDLITGRYLRHRRALQQAANERLDALEAAEDKPDSDSVDAWPEPAAAADEEADLPPTFDRVPLARQRRQAVIAALAEAGAGRVLDLGCGSGALIDDLRALKSVTEIVGVDVSLGVLRLAERRLRLDRAPERQRGRVRLLQSALTYTDDRLVGFDAAVLMEVIEHIDEARLDALAAAVFGHARPSTVVVTTPNVEFNARYQGLPEGKLRHHDHRFEWNRSQFAAWTAGVADRYRYQVELRGVGEPDPQLGPPTQMAIFRAGGGA